MIFREIPLAIRISHEPLKRSLTNETPANPAEAKKAKNKSQTSKNSFRASVKIFREKKIPQKNEVKASENIVDFALFANDFNS
jgi:hypothetical protein